MAPAQTLPETNSQWVLKIGHPSTKGTFHPTQTNNSGEPRIPWTLDTPPEA